MPTSSYSASSYLVYALLYQSDRTEPREEAPVQTTIQFEAIICTDLFSHNKYRVCSDRPEAFFSPFRCPLRVGTPTTPLTAPQRPPSQPRLDFTTRLDLSTRKPTTIFKPCHNAPLSPQVWGANADALVPSPTTNRYPRSYLVYWLL